MRGKVVAMKCLIIGQGKTGSSALFYAIVEQLEDCKATFEPRPIEPEHLEAENVVIKKLIEYLNEDEEKLFDVFDKRIQLVRDPRDSIISRLLYTVWDRKFAYDDEKLEVFLNAVRQKEEEPRSIGVKELYDLMDRLDGTAIIESVKLLNTKSLGFLRKHGDAFYLFHYEDFIRGNLDGLREYLGLNISNDVKVAETFQRVTRKKGFGDWKDWFTESDVDFFRKEFFEISAAFDYNVDWELNEEPVIEPEYASLYVQRMAADRREKFPRKK